MLLDFVAIKDVKPDEEIFLDYGKKLERLHFYCRKQTNLTVIIGFLLLKAKIGRMPGMHMLRVGVVRAALFPDHAWSPQSLSMR
jgi:hypothetical protein